MQENMLIRKVRPEDYGEIAEIYRHYVEDTDISFELVAPTVEEMERRIESFAAKYPCIVCEVDGHIAGYCYAHAWKERPAYSRTLETTVYLSPRFTGRGIGTALMKRLIADCRETGFGALIACITRGNEASCRMHERLGFTQASLFLGVGMKFGRSLDVVDYQLTL